MSPRGNVVRMGRGAISYRTTAPERDVVMHDVVSLVPARPSDVVQQLQKAAGRRAYWPFALAALLLAGLVTGRFGLVVIAVGLPGVLWVALRDRAARAVVVMYDATSTSTAAPTAVSRTTPACPSCGTAGSRSAATAVSTSSGTSPRRRSSTRWRMPSTSAPPPARP